MSTLAVPVLLKLIHYSKSDPFHTCSFVAEKEASTVQKNLKHKCWNVWYEVYLLTEELPAASSRRASSPAPLVGSHATQLPSPTLKKSHKVYCYISQKVTTKWGAKKPGRSHCPVVKSINASARGVFGCRQS